MHMRARAEPSPPWRVHSIDSTASASPELTCSKCPKFFSMCSSNLPFVDNPCGPLPGCNVIRQGRAKGPRSPHKPPAMGNASQNAFPAVSTTLSTSRYQAKTPPRRYQADTDPSCTALVSPRRSACSRHASAGAVCPRLIGWAHCYSLLRANAMC